MKKFFGKASALSSDGLFPSLYSLAQEEKNSSTQDHYTYGLFNVDRRACQATNHGKSPGKGAAPQNKASPSNSP